jgi:hypothetical protein
MVRGRFIVLVLECFVFAMCLIDSHGVVDVFKTAVHLACMGRDKAKHKKKPISPCVIQ